jgi:predicted membrane channel-forming protein YqfA (hemolysin III family)
MINSGPCAFVPGVLFFFFWPNNFQILERMQFKHLDYMGIVLIMLGTVLPVYIVNEAAVREYAWNSATTISVLILSGLTWIVLLLWQWQLSKNPRFRLIRPQLPLRLISDPIMASVFV